MVREAYTTSWEFFGNSTPHSLVEKYGSPLYVYNERLLRTRVRDLTGLSNLPGFRVNYSAKANANPALLRIIREEGCLVDAMSPVELQMNLRAGFKPHEMLYVCNNVSREEMAFVAHHKVLMSVDSLSQLAQYGQVNPHSSVMIRFNPGIGAGHHAKVITGGKETKFGIDPIMMPEVRAILRKYDLHLIGINQHIGSLFMETQGYLDAMDFLLELACGLKNLEIIDFGGGFGIPYHKYEEEKRLDMEELGEKLHAKISQFAKEHKYGGRFFIEPGRYAVAESGLLLGSVHATKQNGAAVYVGTDVGFTVLARPMLYDSFHDIEIYRENAKDLPGNAETLEQTIVGNICESGDILAKKRLLPRIEEGDILGLLDTGAYGYVMASNYNQRLRPAEVLIDLAGNAQLIRRRETFEDICATLVNI